MRFGLVISNSYQKCFSVYQKATDAVITSHNLAVMAQITGVVMETIDFSCSPYSTCIRFLVRF